MHITWGEYEPATTQPEHRSCEHTYVRSRDEHFGFEKFQHLASLERRLLRFSIHSKIVRFFVEDDVEDAGNASRGDDVGTVRSDRQPDQVVRHVEMLRARTSSLLGHLNSGWVLKIALTGQCNLSLPHFGECVYTGGVTREGHEGHNFPGAESLREAPRSPSDVTRTFFSTVHLLPKDLRFELGVAKLASCSRRHLTSLRSLCVQTYDSRNVFSISNVSSLASVTNRLTLTWPCSIPPQLLLFDATGDRQFRI